MAASRKNRGSLSSRSPLGLLRRFRDARESGLLRTEGQPGVGSIWLKKGRIVACELGGLRGKVALHCILAQRSGSFEFQPGDIDRVSEFEQTTQQLLSEHNQQATEWADLVPRLPPVGSVLTLEKDILEERRANLTPNELAMVSLIGERGRLPEIVEKSGASAQTTLASLAQLFRLGVVRAASGERPKKSSNAPASVMPIRAVGSGRGSETHSSNPPGPDLRSSYPPGHSGHPPGGTVPGFPQVVVDAKPDAQVRGDQATGSAQSSQRAEPGASFERTRSSNPPPTDAGDPTVEKLQRIGRYEVLKRLGRGGMGTVFQAKLRGEGGFERFFALKVLRSHLATDPKAVKSLYDEARISSRLNHANVVSVVDVGTHGDQPYLVMDYVHGLSLSELLSTKPTGAPPACVVTLMLDALAGLEAVHSAVDADGTPLTLIHHDVSPHNYLVGVDGVCRLTDFGIAALDAGEDKPAELGKPAYMSPERVQGLSLDARSDIFSAGVIFWGALTGQRLFDAEDPNRAMGQVLNAVIPPPSTVNGSPPSLDSICMKALARDRAQRYPSAGEMAEELRRVASDSGLIATAAEVGAWVRTAKGQEIRSEAATAANDSDDFDGDSESRSGNTVPLTIRKQAPLPLRIAQYTVAAIAIGVLAAAVLAPDDAIDNLLGKQPDSSERGGEDEVPSDLAQEASPPPSVPPFEPVAPSIDVASSSAPAVLPVLESPGQRQEAEGKAQPAASDVAKDQPAAAPAPRPRPRPRWRPVRRAPAPEPPKAPEPPPEAKPVASEAPATDRGESEVREPGVTPVAADDPLAVRVPEEVEGPPVTDGPPSVPPAETPPGPPPMEDF